MAFTCAYSLDITTPPHVIYHFASGGVLSIVCFYRGCALASGGAFRSIAPEVLYVRQKEHVWNET